MTDKSTVLQRVRDVHLHLDSSNQIVATMSGRRVDCGARGLAILDAFAEPRSITSVMQSLPVAGAQDWANIGATIVKLQAAGILLRPDAAGQTLKSKGGGFDAASIHIDMLNDTARTLAYLQAIAEVVKPGDVVVEIGTGTGILATAAARSGARRVYAIEASAIADTAAQVYADNGVADNITLIRGWSTEVELPERADVVISEVIGDNPLGERVREITADALARFAKPNVRLLPSGLTINATLVGVDEAMRNQHICADFQADYWQTLYDLDLSAFATASTAQAVLHYLPAQRAQQWPRASAHTALATFDLAQAATQLNIDTQVRTQATSDCAADGVLLTFDLRLSPGVTLSTNLDAVASDNHWFSPLWILPEPVHAKPDDTIEIHYRMSPGEESCTVRVLSI
jgi:2-polyprenyl-3-methyl-5-hydroxy-6-metoxy-1,4-benzoquinol methylase